MTRLDPDSEQALEHAPLKLFQQIGWEPVDCYEEVNIEKFRKGDGEILK